MRGRFLQQVRDACAGHGNLCGKDCIKCMKCVHVHVNVYQCVIKLWSIRL